MKRVLMFDAIPMQGGSKIANAELIKQCDQRDVISYVATTNPEHWTATFSSNPRVQVLKIKRSPITSHHGIAYWLMNCFYLVQLILVTFKLPNSTGLWVCLHQTTTCLCTCFVCSIANLSCKWCMVQSACLAHLATA